MAYSLSLSKDYPIPLSYNRSLDALETTAPSLHITNTNELTLNISTLGSLLGSLAADTWRVGCCPMVSSLGPFSGREGYSKTGSGLANNWLSIYKRKITTQRVSEENKTILRLCCEHSWIKQNFCYIHQLKTLSLWNKDVARKTAFVQEKRCCIQWSIIRFFNSAQSTV